MIGSIPTARRPRSLLLVRLFRCYHVPDTGKHRSERWKEVSKLAVALTCFTWFSQTLFQSKQTQDKSEPELIKVRVRGRVIPTYHQQDSDRFHEKGNIILWQPFPHSFSNSSLFPVVLLVRRQENNIPFETECCFQTWLNKNNEVKRCFNHHWPHFFFNIL